MKKTIALLLVLVLCLSLCACGKKTEAVEITIDNWEQYFTISYVDTWQKNSFGEYDDLKVDAVFALKPEYIGRIADKKDSTMVVDFSCDGTVKGANIDFESQTYTIVNERKVEPFQEIFSIDCKQLDTPYNFTSTNLEPATIDGIRYIMVCENGVINRIQGTIHI